MNPLIELWIASALGAALFFAAGYSLSSIWRRTELVLADTQLSQARAALEHGQHAYAAQSREVDHLDHRAQRAEQSALELSDALASARAECLRLDKELRDQDVAEELRARLEQAEWRGIELERELRARRGADRTPELQRELVELRQLMEAKTKEQAHWENHARLLEASARAEGSADQEALALEVKRMRREERERQAVGRAVAERLTRLEASAKENILLRKQRDNLTAEVQQLREGRLQSGERPQLSSSPASSGIYRATREASDWTEVPRVWEEHETLASVLERQLALLVEREPGVTAVLSDEHGLPLVGTGPEHEQEAVSVVTSLIHGLTERARELVGLDQVELVEMVDGQGRALRVRLFQWEDQPLALGYVGRPQLAQSENEARMVSTFPQLRVVRSA